MKMKLALSPVVPEHQWTILNTASTLLTYHSKTQHTLTRWLTIQPISVPVNMDAARVIVVRMKIEGAPSLWALHLS